MKLAPVMTEKSLKDAKLGVYTFWVDPKSNKNQIKNIINQAFGVHTNEVRTVNFKSRTARNMRGRFHVIKAQKKAFVRLAEKEKIELFETKK